MKVLQIIILLMSGICFAQSKEITTQISQEIRPDYATASHLIVTRMFAKETNGSAWIEIYEHETTVKKFRDSAQAKREEYARAEEAGKQLLAEGKIPEKRAPLLGNETIER